VDAAEVDPAAIGRQVQEMLAGNPTMPWDEAVAVLAASAAEGEGEGE
jgi:hypothetical protein